MNTKTPSGTRADVGLWIVAILTGATVLLQPIVGQASSLVLILLGLIFVFWHGGRRYGAINIIMLFVITELVGNTMENLSIASGFRLGIITTRIAERRFYFRYLSQLALRTSPTDM